MSEGRYPGGARFAFTMFDDTDDATEANVAPVYDLLTQLGMRVTKTVWPVACPEGSRIFYAGHTLDDPGYAEFVQRLQRDGHEIAFHGATMESSTRERIERALARFRETFGHEPRSYANHAQNRENLYWGTGRVDFPPVRWFYRFANKEPAGWYQGHLEESPYYWGDLLRQRIEYMRNLTFHEVNLLNINPTLPYRDPNRPLAPWWFSATDAEDAAAFNQRFNEEAQDRLEREGGVCIVATHLGKRFTRDGVVHPRTEQLLRRLAGKRGWFPTVSELLDWLRQERGERTLPAAEWRRMQIRWAIDLVRQRLQPPPPVEWPA